MKSAAIFMGLALAAAPAAAQPPEAKSEPWGVDYGAKRCTLYKKAGDGTLFAVRIIPGRSSPELLFVRDDWAAAGAAAKVSLRFPPSVAARKGDPVWTDVAGKRALTLDRLGGDTLDLLAAATGIALVHGERRLELPLTGTAKAVGALRTCHADLLRSWGGDPEAAAKLREGPQQIWRTGTFFNMGDYPPGAIARGESGTVVVRLDVSAAGALDRCVVVAASGSEELDEATCRVLEDRVGFMPAVGADGAPVAASDFMTVSWVHPDS